MRERFRKVFCNVLTYVSCREYYRIPLSAQLCCESRWHHEWLIYSPLTENNSVKGVFIYTLDGNKLRRKYDNFAEFK